MNYCGKSTFTVLKDFECYIIIPTFFFLKKNSEGGVVIASVRPSVQIYGVSYSHEWGVQRQMFWPRPAGALGRGQKVKYNLISHK